MNADKQKAIVEAVKEFFRVVVIAGVSAALVAGQAYIGGIHDVVLQVALGAFLTSVGKAWDRKVHEDPTTAATGVLPF